ncbi:MAG: TIGR03067 domain-containing protein [Planctomycetales bacterium]
MHTRLPLLLLSALLCTSLSVAADPDPETKQFQGKWEVVELVEDGKVIPKEAIKEWLPSGGLLEIDDNAIIFTSNEDGKKHVKLYSVDPTQYPKGIDLSTRQKKESAGIYRFDNGRLIVCFADPEASTRPKEFSAKEGSKQLLMVLQRLPQTPKEPAPAPKQAPSGTTAKVLTDAQVKELLKGTWRYTDSAGALFVTFNADGSFSTVREVKEIRLFQKVFVQTPISTGTWSIRNGKLALIIESSVKIERLNKEFDFAIRSITTRDLIFVDFLGRVGQAVKVQ